MAKVKRGRFTISANIVLTALVITRGFSFGLIMMSLYIKYGDDILDDDVIKIADLEYAAGMPLGTAVKSVVFSFVGVFVLELITGVCGMLGVLRHSKTMLSITVIMNSLMIVIYGIYIVIISIIYNKKYNLYMLESYIDAAVGGNTSYTYSRYAFPNFKRMLGCMNHVNYCTGIYAERFGTYMEAYFGLIVTSIMCQVVSIIAVEYTYRKLEIKENKSTVSKNKYYLLLSLQYGIFHNCVIFIKKNWKRSKIIFVSTTLKIASIVFAAGFLGLGLTLTGDVMIYDFYIRKIFRRIEFYQYNFYDILVGIAASAIVIGILTIINATVGLFGSWKKSSVLIMTSTVTSLVLTIPRIIAFLLFGVFMAKINNDMKFQLKLLQEGHFLNDDLNDITKYWNHMLLTLQCCGVDNPNDTIHSTYGSIFCCKNAHESRIDSQFKPSLTELNYFGGCGEYKTSTCSESILFKTRMYIGWFLTLLLLQICLETVTVLLANQEYSIMFSIEKFKKTVVFRKILDGIKLLFISNWKRSKVACASIACILVLSVGLLGLAINIRYDWVFGNKDIQGLFSQINIENISLNSTVDYFSIVAVTFSVINILASIYSTISLVLVCGKWRYRSTILSLSLWCALGIACIIQFGLMVKVTAHINQALEDTLQNKIMRYQYSHESAHYDMYSLYWNTLFLKAQCCGVGTSNVLSINVSEWYDRNRDSIIQQIPVQCCKSQTVVYPYASTTDTDCTSSHITSLYHTQGCDAAIQNQFEKYSIPFMVFTFIIIVAEICLIIQHAKSLIPSRQISNVEQQLIGTNDTKEKSCATTSKSDKKHSNENVRYTEQTSITKKETPVIKNENLNMANISSEENLTNSMAFKPTVSLDNEPDENHENMQEQDQKIIDDNNETKNVNSSKDKNDQQGIKMTPLEENTNVLSEKQISEKNKNTEINDGTSTSLDVDN